MPRPASLPRIARFALGAALVLGGCLGKENPKGTEVENELGAGRLFRADGRPAAGATVRIYAVGSVPGPGESGAALVTRADAQGVYRAKDLGKGEFNILAEGDGLFAYQDSLSLSEAAGPIPPDTLRPPGTVRGVIAMQPQHSPRSVTVQLLGTNRFANVAEDGSFAFPDLAGGRYSVRLVSTIDGYTPTFLSFRAVAGSDIALADTLRPIFTGMPIVEGLAAEYDTLSGVATMRWKAASLSQLQDYIIDRDEGIDAAPSGRPFASTRATFFRDTIWTPLSPLSRYPAGAFPFSDTSSRRPYTYRVRVRSRTQETGPYYLTAAVNAASPYFVTTVHSLALSGPHPETATVGDSLTLVFSFRNPTRRIKMIHWSDDPGEPAFRSAEMNAYSGADTLRIAPAAKAGRIFRLATTVDEAGTLMKSQIEIRVVDDRPVASLLLGGGAGPDSISANQGDTIRVRAAASDTGRIAKREWYIGFGEPVFAPGGDDTSLVISGAAGTRLRCAFRATDEDGNADTAELGIRILPWRTLAAMPTPRMDHTLEVVGGKIYAIGGLTILNGAIFPSRSVEMFDPATGTWVVKSHLNIARVGHSSVVMNGEIMVAGGWDLDNETLGSVELYDPATDTWRMGKEMSVGKAYAGLAKEGGKVVSFEGETRDPGRSSMTPTGFCEAYDTLSRAWEPCYIVHSLPGYRPRARFLTAVLKGKTYALGGVTEDAFLPLYNEAAEPNPGSRVASRFHYLFDFAAHGMAEWPRILPFAFFSRASAVHGEWILMAGGDRMEGRDSSANRFEALNPETGELRRLGTHAPARSGAAGAVVDGRFYLIGGGTRAPYSISGTTQVYSQSLDAALATP